MSACGLARVRLLDASAAIFSREREPLIEGHAAFEAPAVLRGPVTKLRFSDDMQDMAPWRFPRGRGRCW